MIYIIGISIAIWVILKIAKSGNSKAVVTRPGAGPAETAADGLVDAAARFGGGFLLGIVILFVLAMIGFAMT